MTIGEDKGFLIAEGFNPEPGTGAGFSPAGKIL